VHMIYTAGPGPFMASGSRERKPSHQTGVGAAILEYLPAEPPAQALPPASFWVKLATRTGTGRQYGLMPVRPIVEGP